MAEYVNYPKIDRVYNHYKGGNYYVLGMSKHTETGELLVIYQSIEFGSLHARPLTSWNEPVVEAGFEHPRFYLQDEY